MDERLENTIRSYDACAGAFEEAIGSMSNYHSSYDDLLALLPTGAAVLDLACGPGNISRYLLDRKDLELTCVDLSEEMLAIAKRRLPGARFVAASIAEFESEPVYDAAVCGFGIPFVDRKNAAESIRRAYQALKNGGIYYLSFMDGDSEGYEKASFGGDEEFYFYRHPKAEIRDMVGKAGFRIREQREQSYEADGGALEGDVIILAEKREE